MRWLWRRQTLHALRMQRASQRVPVTIRLIAFSKVIEGGIFVIVALALARLLHAPDLMAALHAILEHIHIDPDGDRAQRLMTWITGVPHARLQLVEAGLFAYAALYLIEGIGLWFDRPWAEWLTVVGTAAFLPFEFVHLWEKPSVGIAITLLINLAIVAFLARRIARRRHDGDRPRIT